MRHDLVLCFIDIDVLQDFEEIGIDKRGFRLRLERAVKQLAGFRYGYKKDASLKKDVSLNRYWHSYNQL